MDKFRRDTSRRLHFASRLSSAVLANLKKLVVQRMFWGRGSMYKNSFHLIILIITFALLASGVSSKIATGSANQKELSVNYGAVGNNDLLSQGGGINAVVAVDETAKNYQVYKHQVDSNENLKQIAQEYKVSVDTVIWANSKLINPFNPEVKPGMELVIPEIDGVMIEVKAGDTVYSIAEKTRGNAFDIIELNELAPPKFKLKVGQVLFVPSGELPPPPIPDLFKDYFANPLSHPKCAGYVFIRGITSYHSGIDLAKGGGCPIRAVAAGTVTLAGWYNAGGYSVIIDHGSGIKSYYYHGNGEIWVKKGDYVRKGQNLLYMGCSGNCTGTHLHLSIAKNGALVNPANVIPY